MTIEKLKKELGLSQKDLAQFFDMTYGAFANKQKKDTKTLFVLFMKL